MPLQGEALPHICPATNIWGGRLGIHSSSLHSGFYSDLLVPMAKAKPWFMAELGRGVKPPVLQGSGMGEGRQCYQAWV